MMNFPWPRPAWVAAAVGCWIAIMGVDWHISLPHHAAWNWYLTVIWALGLPAVLVATVGGIVFLRWRRHYRPMTLGPRPARLIYQIPTIGRDDVWPALCRVIDSCVAAQAQARVPTALWVITEEGAPIISRLRQHYAEDTVQILVVPRLYQTPNGSRFKARANQYAHEVRQKYGLTKATDWIFHLDDDTSVPLDTHRQLEAFMTSWHPYTLAQGLLTFARDVSPHHGSWLADAVRPADDITRFFLFSGILHRPWVGLHGENLLLRADREAAIGWDFGPTVVAEDAYFGVAFAERFPGEATFLPIWTRGASPGSWRALQAQRARWVEGLWRFLLDRTVPGRSKAILGSYLVSWATAFLQNAVPILALTYLAGWDNTSPVARWVSLIWGSVYGFWAAAYWIGYRINILVSAQRPPWWRQGLDMTLLLIGLPVMSWMELLGTAQGLWRLSIAAPHQQFTVIAKSL